MKCNYIAGHHFFVNCLYDEDKQEVYARRGFQICETISSKDWECMGSEIVDKDKRGTVGHDLRGGFEVKSAKFGNGYMWDMHHIRAIEKIEGAQALHYIFITYSEDLKTIEVRLAEGDIFKDYFDKWRVQYDKHIQKYPTKRFQRSIPFKAVKSRCDVAMRISDKELVYPINIDKEEEDMIEFTKNPEEYDNIAKAWLDQRKGKVEKKEETPPQVPQEKDEKAE